MLVDIRTGFKNEAAALFVVHDLNPRAYAARVEGFVQAQNWLQDDTNIRMREDANGPCTAPGERPLVR